MSDDIGRKVVVQVNMTTRLLADIDEIAEREKGPDDAKPNRSRVIRRLLTERIAGTSTPPPRS